MTAADTKEVTRLLEAAYTEADSFSGAEFNKLCNLITDAKRVLQRQPAECGEHDSEQVKSIKAIAESLKPAEDAPTIADEYDDQGEMAIGWHEDDNKAKRICDDCQRPFIGSRDRLVCWQCGNKDPAEDAPVEVCECHDEADHRDCEPCPVCQPAENAPVEVDRSLIPNGWRAVAWRLPCMGETYLYHSNQTVATRKGRMKLPHLILKPADPAQESVATGEQKSVVKPCRICNNSGHTCRECGCAGCGCPACSNHVYSDDCKCYHCRHAPGEWTEYEMQVRNVCGDWVDFSDSSEVRLRKVAE